MNVARRVLHPDLHVVLLAGGSGTRFWPLSRARRPKQFLPLAGKRPLLLDTWTRLETIVPASRLWVVTPAALAAPVRRMLPRLGRGRLIVEPSPRDTGPAVTLACATVARKAPAALIGVFPTDHVVHDRRSFERSVRIAASAADRGALVCLGVVPDRPATGFGYVRCARRPEGVEAAPVKQFVEKPDLATARRFVRSGRYLWNAGMFVWRAERFLDEAKRTAPSVLRAVEGHLEGRKGAWERAPRISVDYAVMEKAAGVEVVPLRAGWDDVGSWDAAASLRERTRIGAGGEIVRDSPGSVVFGGDRLVAVVGVPGVVVVDTADAILVVSRERSQGVREVVDELRARRRRDLL